MKSQYRPKIVYVLPEFNPDTGSHFFHLYELVKRAAERLDILVVVECAKGDVGKLGVRAYGQRFSWPPLRFLELLAVLAGERFCGRRYFYTHYSYYGAIASWLVTGLLGGRNYYWNCGQPWKYRRPGLAEAVFRFILKHSILVTGTSGLARAYAERYALKPGRIRVMPNWINLARFGGGTANDYDRSYKRKDLGISPQAKVVLFVHRLSRRKGAHLLPEIIAEVTQSHKNAIFVIVGDGPEREHLKSEIRSQKSENFVRLMGEVPNREIPDYFCAADVLLMPSEEEGFPHVLLEAMASGVPYVSSDVGGVSEITPPELKDYIVPAGGASALAGKVIKLLTNSPAELSMIGQAQRRWVRKYDTASVLPVFIDLF